MTRALILAVFAMAACAHAAEPVAGTWLVKSQVLNGEKSTFEPLTLRVSESGDKLLFAFSVPVNRVHYVSMSYLVRLDGSEADVKNGQGEKLGVIRMTKTSASHYKLTLGGPYRPTTEGKLTVSPDGKSLTSESDVIQAGKPMHLMQLFQRP